MTLLPKAVRIDFQLMKILLIKLGAIGDVIQTAAAVRLLRNETNVTKLDWVVGETAAPLVKSFEVADTVIEINESQLFEGSAYKNLFYLLKVIFRLAALDLSGYDKVIIPQLDRRYKLLCLLVRARKKLTLKDSVSALSQTLQRNRIYELYCLLSGVDVARLDLSKVLSSLGESALAKMPEAGATLPSNFVAICPGGAKNLIRENPLRRWPIQKYSDLAKKLVHSGREVVLVGGEGDLWVTDHFENVSVTNLIGRTNLLQTIKVLSCADVVIAHDSGPMHMASITRSALVAIFGPTPANAFLPLGREKTIVLREESRVSCSPCYDGKNYARCDFPICMDQISVDTVFDALKTISGKVNS